jgi:hypothetical protein
MPLSPFDLAVAFIIVVTMPVIIWVNYKKREGGLQGYLWRESPTLVWVSLVFLGLILLFSVVELLAHYGFLSVETDELVSMILGIPLLVLSIAIIGLAIVAVIRYLRARPSA